MVVMMRQVRVLSQAHITRPRHKSKRRRKVGVVSLLAAMPVVIVPSPFSLSRCLLFLLLTGGSPFAASRIVSAIPLASRLVFPSAHPISHGC